MVQWEPWDSNQWAILHWVPPGYIRVPDFPGQAQLSGSKQRDKKYSKRMSTTEDNCRALARVLAHHLLGRENSPCPSGVSREFVETVKQVRSRFEREFRADAHLLLAETGHVHERHLRCLLAQMFPRGECNWGRIATVYAFATVLAEEAGSPDYLKVVRVTGDFVAENLAGWIRGQGGWTTGKPARFPWQFRSTNPMVSFLSGLAAFLRLYFGP